MPEEIDYKGIAEGLMTELENARIALADMHFAKNRVYAWQRISAKRVTAKLVTNPMALYLTIVACYLVIRLLIQAWKRGRFHKE